jgi:hypothetical protein
MWLHWNSRSAVTGTSQCVCAPLSVCVRCVCALCVAVAKVVQLHGVNCSARSLPSCCVLALWHCVVCCHLQGALARSCRLGLQRPQHHTQEIEAYRPSPSWLTEHANPHTGVPLHSTALNSRASPPGEVVDCSQFSAEVPKFPREEYPSLESILCSLVIKGDDTAKHSGEGRGEGRGEGHGKQHARRHGGM